MSTHRCAEGGFSVVTSNRCPSVPWKNRKRQSCFSVNDIPVLPTRQQSLSVRQCPPEKKQQQQCNSLVAFISLTASLLEKKTNSNKSPNRILVMLF